MVQKTLLVSRSYVVPLWRRVQRQSGLGTGGGLAAPLLFAGGVSLQSVGWPVVCSSSCSSAYYLAPTQPTYSLEVLLVC